jgi:SOS response regulatory protein OraA/RecX
MPKAHTICSKQASLSRKKNHPPTPIEDSLLLQFLLHKAHKAGRGSVWLRHVLEERGFARPLIQAAATLCNHKAYTHAQTLLYKKFGAIETATQQTKTKMARFLLARGFSPECVMKIFDPPQV